MREESALSVSHGVTVKLKYTFQDRVPALGLTLWFGNAAITLTALSKVFTSS